VATLLAAFGSAREFPSRETGFVTRKAGRRLWAPAGAHKEGSRLAGFSTTTDGPSKTETRGRKVAVEVQLTPGIPFNGIE
jgi:hypothetical protein